MRDEMGCYWCNDKAKARLQRVTTDFNVGQGTVYIHNVPAYVCERCGEQYFNLEVVEREFAILRKYESRPLSQGEVIECDYETEEVTETDGA